MPSPLTESLVVHWRPTLDYHLHRLDVLEEVRSSGRLQWFLVRPDVIGFRTKTTQLTMAEDEVTLRPRGSLSADEALDALRAAFRCAAPLEYHFALTFQFVVPLVEQSYDEARTSALQQMSVGALGASDFAMLVDGKVGDDVWHCEFGIVQEEDITPHLSRQVGRMRHFADEMPPFSDLPQGFAPVSLFADVLWHVPNRPTHGDESVDAIAEKVRSLREEADRIVSAIYAPLCQVSLRPATQGAHHE